MRGRFRHVRAKHDQGWSIAELAQHYTLPESEIVRSLERRRPARPSRAMPPTERQRRAEQRTRQRAKASARARAQRWLPDPSEPEAWRWSDAPDDLVKVLTPPTAPELLEQPAAAEIPAMMREPRAPEPWSGPISPHASPGKPRKVTAEILARALELRAAGVSWPEIARKFGCHRMAFYHALRRPRPQ
ncbi:MAG: helix-turn-helix domain-containing protein [Isosphaeraceae bacterium]|jgi:Homeodomain-like domain-containing protein